MAQQEAFREIEKRLFKLREEYELVLQEAVEFKLYSIGDRVRIFWSGEQGVVVDHDAVEKYGHIRIRYWVKPEDEDTGALYVWEDEVKPWSE